MEAYMKWNVISRLKMIFAAPALHRPEAGNLSPDWIGIPERNRELSARDYEIYYWCSTPAPWY
jgi:hypothetical protein